MDFNDTFGQIHGRFGDRCSGVIAIRNVDSIDKPEVTHLEISEFFLISNLVKASELEFADFYL